MEFLALGYISGTHGLDGTVKLVSTSDFAHERYTEVKNFYLFSKSGVRTPVTLVSFKMSGELHYLKFAEFTTLEEAQLLKGSLLQIKKEDALMPEGFYFFSDLVDCEVYDERDVLLGKVIKVEEFPAQITLRVRQNNDKEFFVPFIEQFIIDVDISKKKIIIKVLEGLI